ncbi:MAG TPA: penicillin-binding protein 2 [Candidatus Humimicrobiaceae bacterium]|nr:penicillin-binding protein 2 [Candidatus Humimicrobiaceae bacterium]
MFGFLPSYKFKNQKKNGPHVDIEPHEILLDKLARKKDEELGVSEKKLEVPLLKIILQGLLIFSLLLIFLLFTKTFQLQILDHKNFLALAEGNKYVLRQIQAERGVIYDRNLKQLVFNQSSFDLILEKSKLPSSDEERIKILKEISQILALDYGVLEKKIDESENSQISIAENLGHKTLIILETKLTEEFPGFQIVNNPTREYREGKNFSHLIGYTGRIQSEELKKEPQLYLTTDYVGRLGIENSYEEVLRKNPGQMRIEKDALGNIISQEIIQSPESGQSIVLWLDSDLQKKTREVLEKKCDELGINGAAAIALDPNTGGVLSLVSLPGFDNNLFQKGVDPEELQELLDDPFQLEPLFNRAIAGRGYLTGSVIKPFIASAALEEKIISPEKQIYAGGFIEVPDQYNPEKTYIYRDWKVHGWTDLRKAIANSVNVYFYAIGGGYEGQTGLGPTKIKKYLELFGWGEKTGIDLSNEGTGLVPDPEWKKSYFTEKRDQIWYDGNTYYLSIGQEYVSATPLQVAVASVAIANGGKLFQPKVVKSIVDTSMSSFRIVGELEPKIIRENFIDSKNIQVVREGMRQTVTSGTATGWLNLLPVSSAAKTGSAQTGKFDEYGNELLHNWITVFAPYENPEIVLTIMMEDVSGVMGGPLPVAKEILEWYFTR